MLELQLENTNELIKENDEDLNNFLSSLKIMDNKVEELDNLIVDFFIDRLDEKHNFLNSLILLLTSLFMLNITLLTEKSMFYLFMVIIVNIGSIFFVKNKYENLNRKCNKKLEYIKIKRNDLIQYIQESNIVNINITVRSNKLKKKINKLKYYLLEKYENVTSFKKNKIRNKLSFIELSELSVVFDLKKLITKIEQYKKKNSIKTSKNNEILNSMYEL